MLDRNVIKISAFICIFLFTSLTVQAAPIRTLPDLTGISIFEGSGGVTQLFYIPGTAIGDAALNVKLDDRLSGTNNDYRSPANEFYDFFFSNADGSFNIDGDYLTITAIFDGPPDSGLNINGARLEFIGGTLEYASSVLSFVALGEAPLPGTVGNALGDTPNSTTFLGDTSGLPDSSRLSLTLGFDSSAPSAIPVPAAIWMFGTALIGLVGFCRRRRSA